MKFHVLETSKERSILFLARIRGIMFPSSLRSPFVITKMSVVISAGKKNSLDDIIRVAVNNQPILLAGGSVPVKSAGTNPVIAQRFSAQTDVAGIERLPRSICRAGLLCYISFLMQSRAPNMCLLETVARLLNDNIVPAFSTSESANNELITFLSNGGVCYSNENDDLVDSAFLDVKVVCLTNEEAEQILAYPFLAVGLGCIVAAASMNFIRLIDSVSALSCEAVGSNAEPYDAANFEVCRPHRGQMLSASNLRLLLDGSKRTGSYPKDKLPVLVSLHNAPQVTGPCRDVIIASVK